MKKMKDKEESSALGSLGLKPKPATLNFNAKILHKTV